MLNMVLSVKLVVCTPSDKEVIVFQPPFSANLDFLQITRKRDLRLSMHQRVFTDVSDSSMANSVLEAKEAQPSKSFERTLAPRSPLAAGGMELGDRSPEKECVPRNKGDEN